MAGIGNRRQEIGRCKLWRGHRNYAGYGWVYDAWEGRVIMAHRMAWIRSVGPIPAGKFVLHKCDNPPCIRIDHLYIGDHNDNMRDRKERGREAVVFGEENPNCKLSDAKVRRILKMVDAGVRQVEIAKKFRITQGYVSKLALRKHRCG